MSEINEAWIDRFTLGHFILGLGLGDADVGLAPTVVLAIGWEVLERPLKRRFRSAFPHPSQDSGPNSAIDALAVMAGWWVAP